MKFITMVCVQEGNQQRLPLLSDVDELLIEIVRECSDELLEQATFFKANEMVSLADSFALGLGSHEHPFSVYGEQTFDNSLIRSQCCALKNFTHDEQIKQIQQLARVALTQPCSPPLR